MLDFDEGEEIGLLARVTHIIAFPLPPIAKPVVEAGVRVVKRLEGKIRDTQLRIKATEAAMADLEAKVAGQMGELAAVKEALGMR